MDLADNARGESLRAAVEALYGRFQSGGLTSDDLIDLESLVPPDNSPVVSRLVADPERFEKQFGDFKKSYEIFRLFGEGETVLDVGAHWGYSALAMRHQGCRANIVSIEAMPFHRPPLERLRELAGGWYDYVNVAATDVPQRLTFYVPVVNRKLVGGLSSTGGTLLPSMAMLIARRAGDFPPLSEGAPDEVKFARIEVAGLPIDDVVKALGASRQQVAAIKMDVEGHEEAALRGARHLLTTRRPVLMVEGGMRPPVRAVIQEYGYIRAARVEGQLVRWDGHAKQSDTYWFHPDTIEELRGRGLVPRS
ncbi:MAG TPA: FkbM family methyltransferase [Vicinamibacterales bacterium]|nr:FkbM family methyltransferase [Vicinamibacterales bacterium]